MSSIGTQRSKGSIMRNLGGLERWFYAMDRHRPNHFSIAATLEGGLNPVSLTRSLLALQDRHPLLTARLQHDDLWNIAFHPSAPSPIPVRIVKRVAEDQWSEELAREAGLRIDTASAPLMRAVLLGGTERSDLILTIHHSVTDGMGLFYLLRDLIGALAGSSLEKLPLASSIEDLRPARITPERTVTPEGSVRSTEELAAYRPVRESVRKVNHLQLSQEQTGELQRRARAEGVTIHAALTAGLALAGREGSMTWRSGPVRVFTPMNLRKMHGIGEDLAVALGAGVVRVPATPEGIWDEARAAMNELSFFRQEEHAFMISEMLGDAAKDPENTAALTAQYAYDLILTNPGKIDLALDQSQLKVVDLWGPSVLMGFAGEQSVSALMYDGRLHLTHISTSPIEFLLSRAVALLLDGK